MTYTIVIISLIASALAQNDQCKRQFVEGTKCFLDYADESVKTHNIDVQTMDDCIRRMSKSCSSVVTSQFGSQINDVDPVTMKKCAKQSMEPAKRQMKECMNRNGYKNYEEGGAGTQRQGIKVLGLISIIKVGNKACKPLDNCLPQNFAEFKEDLCNGKDKCFPQSLKNKCPNMESDLEKTSCECYKELDNKQEMMNEFKACIGQANESFLSRVGGRFVNNVLLREVKKGTCRKDYSENYDICEDENFGKNARNNNNGATNDQNNGNASWNNRASQHGNAWWQRGFGGK